VIKEGEGRKRKRERRDRRDRGGTDFPTNNFTFLANQPCK